MDGEAKFTPGPWVAGEVRYAGRVRLVQHDGARGFVAEVQAPVVRDELDETTRDANAHLIAAAPEMLDALRFAEIDLERLIDRIDRTGAAVATGHSVVVVDRVRAAIAKAEGRES